ncbi:MAG: hypothetical protein AAGF23_14785 [Acidobacteriota bacterium]
MSSVHFTLETTIPDTTIYITYGSMNCIKSKEVPESITATSPASGQAKANTAGSCSFEDRKIKLYFWADPNHTEQVAKIKLYEDSGTEVEVWSKEIQSVAAGYDMEALMNDTSEYTFTLSKPASGA